MTETSETPGRDLNQGTTGAATTGAETNRAVTSDQVRARSMQRTVLRKHLRRRRARQENADSVWVWLGTFGLVGWTVMVPTLAGLAFGIFLDNRVDASVSFTITFLIVGVAVGGSMAWYWVRQESERDGET